MEQNVKYVFGSFYLHTDTQLLWHEGRQTNLPPKVYQVLLYLLQHPGRLVFREELFEAVWQGRVVEDTSLRLAINHLRKALQDESKTPQYILTVCKRGYRFLPEVKIETGLEEHHQNHSALTWCYNSTQPEKSLLTPIFTTEQATLFQAYQEAGQVNRRLVLLKGDRGCGKTTLLANFLSSIPHPELRVLNVTCLPLEGATEPFLPLLESLAQQCRESSGNGLIDCLHRIAPTWLYQMLNLLHPEQLASLSPKVMFNNSGRMLREGADLFESLSTQATFILILDNAQWSDSFSLDLINLLMSRSTQVRLLIVVSYRTFQVTGSIKQINRLRDEFGYRGLVQELSLQNSAALNASGDLASPSSVNNKDDSVELSNRRSSDSAERRITEDRRNFSLGRRQEDCS